MPKEEGGLGLRSLEIWNKAAMLKHLWSLCTDSASSLWCSGDCSWSWGKILGLRDIGRDKMKYSIGNGRHVSLWYDNWHPLGPLEKILGERIIRESRLSRLAKESLRLCWPKVTWYHIVWFPKCIPRHALILWLTILGGIYTQTKLLRFGLVKFMCCVLCGCSLEDLDHLFFACPFFEHVWHALHVKCNLPWVQRSWADTLSWMEQFRGRSMQSIVIRLMFAASIYTIRSERNVRTHGEAPKHKPAVIRDIIFSVCAR
ncbi:uncharacterized protein LOC111376347 [Olea europaea var. sylvestris]|uniref:uncharacterized protein LOC111376347 n=1 Tax=Olea europaea var. sylvestris TaxID=158386 RepID=UPI000C1D5639|nr:uncharacterized protein LOC111376347 [Olea europaea var. sylvestris]